jgi:hypothetical protein
MSLHCNSSKSLNFGKIFAAKEHKEPREGFLSMRSLRSFAAIIFGFGLIL